MDKKMREINFEINHLYNQGDIDKLHSDFRQYKLHFLRMLIHHKHCSKCVLIDYTIASVGSRCCKHMERSCNQLSYYKDLQSMDQLGIDT